MKSVLKLVLAALLLSSVAAYAVFPRPTVYWGIGNLGGCANDSPTGWNTTNPCTEYQATLVACKAVATAVSGIYYNVRAATTTNPVGDYECIGNYDAGCPVTTNPNGCFLGLSAHPVPKCPDFSSASGVSSCVCNASFQQANNTCSGGDNNGKQCYDCGNPVNPANGNKVEEVTVYRGQQGFELSLAFNTYDNFAPRFGRRWRDSFHREVLIDGANAMVYRPDGRALQFAPSGGGWMGDADTQDRLIELQNPPGTRIGWQLSSANGDEIETYDAAGRLLSIQSRSGLTQTLAYSDGTTGPNGGVVLDANGNPTATALPAGLLIRASDAFGRTLSFGYNEVSRVVKLTDPAGGVYRFGYKSFERLASIQFPDGRQRSFLYNESAHTGGANLSYALTGIVDENGARFASFDYDAQQRSVATERAGGTLRYTLSYGSGSTSVTDPLGTTRGYAFQSVLGAFKNTGITGAVCPECGPASQSFDANGNLASRTDWNGNRTNYTYDLTRNLETSRTEGLTSSGGSTPQTRTVSTAWHASFRLPTQIAEPLRITTSVYDTDGSLCGARGALCSRTVQASSDANGSQGLSATPIGLPRTWSYTYNANGFVLSVDGPRTDLTDLTSYTYYANDDPDPGKRGNVAAITNAAGHATSITEYNAHGQPLTIVDPNGLVTTLGYDVRQRLVSRNVGGEVTSYDYDGAGQLTKVTLPDASSLSYAYDSAHRLTGIADSLGNRIAYTLDAMGNRTREDVLDPSNALAQTRSRVYSNLNRLFQEIGAASQVTEYAYDNQGNVASVRDPLNKVTSNQYDALNRLRQVTDPALGVTQYGYNGLDALAQVSDPRGLVTGYSVDGLGNLIQQVSPDTGTSTSTYDAAGNLLTQTDAKGQTTTYAYDALNRVTSITFADGAKQTYAYDQGANAIGRLSTITEVNPANQITAGTAYGYDAKGRVASESRSVNGLAYLTAYAYDGAGRLSGITYPSGRSVAYAFDALGRVSQVSTTKDSQTQVVVQSVQYHPFGAVKGYTLGNGQSYLRGIDQDGRVASYTLAAQTFAIGYDAASRVAFISDLGNPSNSNTYGYDSLDRLTQAVAPGTPYAYSYDALGNRLSKTVGAATDSYSYGATSNRIGSISPASGPLRSFAFDANGSTTSDGLNSYAYDARGRMVQASSVVGASAYQVNALGQRIRKSSTLGDSVFHYDTQGHLIAETSPAGALKREVIYLGDIPVGVVK